MHDLPTRSVTEEKYQDENGHAVVKKVTADSVMHMSHGSSQTGSDSTAKQHPFLVCLQQYQCVICVKLFILLN